MIAGRMELSTRPTACLWRKDGIAVPDPLNIGQMCGRIAGLAAGVTPERDCYNIARAGFPD